VADNLSTETQDILHQRNPAKNISELPSQRLNDVRVQLLRLVLHWPRVWPCALEKGGDNTHDEEERFMKLLC
jgi:hypothetical protein